MFAAQMYLSFNLQAGICKSTMEPYSVIFTINLVGGFVELFFDFLQCCILAVFPDVFVEFRNGFSSVTFGGHVGFFAVHADFVPIEHHEMPLVEVCQYVSGVSVEGAFGEFTLLLCF